MERKTLLILLREAQPPRREGETPTDNPQPSTSGCRPKSQPKKKKRVSKKVKTNREESSDEDTVMCLNVRKKRSKKTLTLKKRTQKEDTGAPRGNRNQLKTLSLNEIESLKAKLDEGRLIDLFDNPERDDEDNREPMKKEKSDEVHDENVFDLERKGDGGNEVPVEGNENLEFGSLN